MISSRSTVSNAERGPRHIADDAMIGPTLEPSRRRTTTIGTGQGHSYLNISVAPFVESCGCLSSYEHGLILNIDWSQYDHKPVKPIPEGMHTVTPHLICAGAAEAIEFYKKAFGRAKRPDCPHPMESSCTPASESVTPPSCWWTKCASGSARPKALNGSPVTIHLYVDDVDAFTARALAAGAKSTMPFRICSGAIDMVSSKIRSATVVGRDSRSRRECGGDATGDAEDGQTLIGPQSVPTLP